nr:hypothetical protein [Brucella anthropi]
MRHAISIICVGFLYSSAALAAPLDFQDKLPADVLGMTVKHAKESEGRLIVFYGETVGRATVTIAPALEADTIKSSSATEMGVTPSAQRSLMQAIDQNLAGGTKALGIGYETSPTKISALDVDGKQAICALIERTQAKSNIASGKKQMFLLDRICTSQIGADTVMVYVTTPINEQMRKKITEDQLGFSAIIVKTLSER